MAEQTTEHPLPVAVLVDYLAHRHESDPTEQAWADLTAREQALVREAAVLGFVRGQFYGTDRRTPPDSTIVRDVLTEARAFAGHYPTLNGLTDATVPAPAGAEVDESWVAQAEGLVKERMAFYGYTPERIEAAAAPDHAAAGCEPAGKHGWVCTDENGTPTHPDADEYDLVAEFVMWVLERTAGPGGARG